jgi:type IV secretory pathway VirB3-like protein
MIKTFTIPRCLERTPEIFGLTVQTAVISFALTFLGLIMIAKSIWMSLLMIGVMYANIKLTKKYKKAGGLFNYLMLVFEKKESIRVNCSIKSLLQNNNGR